MIIPVGHYLGPFYPGRDEPMQSHRIRIGADVAVLATEAEFLVWALAHGKPAPDRQWTPQTLTAAAAEQDPRHAARAVDAVLATGALVRLGPDATDPREFARTHRLQPLLVGLGVGPGRPDLYHLGLFGSPPIAAVDTLEFDMWQWAPRVGSLSELLDMQSATASLLGDDLDGVDGLLERAQSLVMNGCAYVDAAAPSTVEPSTVDPPSVDGATST